MRINTTKRFAKNSVRALQKPELGRASIQVLRLYCFEPPLHANGMPIPIAVGRTSSVSDDWCVQRQCVSFIEDAVAGNLIYSTPGAMALGVANWHVESAPDPADIEWHNIGVGRFGHVIRVFGINAMIFLCVLLV
jgi:hypothetical protein